MCEELITLPFVELTRDVEAEAAKQWKVRRLAKE